MESGFKSGSGATRTPRLTWAWLLNVVMPGSGLILARRHWLGLSLSVSFTLSANAAAVGLWVAPLSVGTPLTLTALGLSLAVWLAAQYLLYKRCGDLSGASADEHIQACYRLADQAWRDGRMHDAYGALQVALTVDDETLQTYVRLARLTAYLGKTAEARRAWRRVAELDHNRSFHSEMMESTQQLGLVSE